MTQAGKEPSGVLDISEERKHQQDQYYGANGAAETNGAESAST